MKKIKEGTIKITIKLPKKKMELYFSSVIDDLIFDYLAYKLNWGDAQEEDDTKNSRILLKKTIDKTLKNHSLRWISPTAIWEDEDEGWDDEKIWDLDKLCINQKK